MLIVLLCLWGAGYKHLMMEREAYRPGLGKNQNLVQQLKELQKNPRSLVFTSLAETYRIEGLPHQALEILEEGLVHYPGLASAMIVKARCLFDLRRYAEASAVCREMIAANSGNIKAQKLLADIYVRLGQRKAAIKSLARIITLYPQDKEATKALEELESLEANALVSLKPSAPAPIVEAPPGKIDDFQVGSFKQVLISQPEAISVEKSSPISMEASRVVEESVEDEGLEPTFATRTIAELYLRQGLKRKAMKVLRKILQEDPTNVWARETLQDLGSDGIVPLAPQPKVDPQRAALAAKAKVLEQMLAQVRMHRMRAGNA